MNLFTWLRQKHCRHRYSKWWSRKRGRYGGYVRRCVNCGKIEDYGGVKSASHLHG